MFSMHPNPKGSIFLKLLCTSSWMAPCASSIKVFHIYTFTMAVWLRQCIYNHQCYKCIRWNAIEKPSSTIISMVYWHSTPSKAGACRWHVFVNAVLTHFVTWTGNRRMERDRARKAAETPESKATLGERVNDSARLKYLFKWFSRTRQPCTWQAIIIIIYCSAILLC